MNLRSRQQEILAASGPFHELPTYRPAGDGAQSGQPLVQQLVFFEKRVTQAFRFR